MPIMLPSTSFSYVQLIVTNNGYNFIHENTQTKLVLFYQLSVHTIQCFSDSSDIPKC